MWTNCANKRFPPARFNFLKIHRKKGYQEEGKPDPASHLVKVSTSNISNQQYLRFAERETKDKQEQGKLAIVLKL
jgi:hypothetical protein